jgi:hypothetical protein
VKSRLSGVIQLAAFALATEEKFRSSQSAAGRHFNTLTGK